MTGRQKKAGSGIGFWHMVRDVLVASMNKGQAPLFLSFGVIFLMVWRMPPEDVSKLVFRLVGRFEQWHIWGWVLSGIMLVGWITHVKVQRQIIVGEMRRMGSARTALQRDKLGKLIKSSNDEG